MSHSCFIREFSSPSYTEPRMGSVGGGTGAHSAEQRSEREQRSCIRSGWYAASTSERRITSCLAPVGRVPACVRGTGRGKRLICANISRHFSHENLHALKVRLPTKTSRLLQEVHPQLRYQNSGMKQGILCALLHKPANIRRLQYAIQRNSRGCLSTDRIQPRLRKHNHGRTPNLCSFRMGWKGHA